jgi:hypothetical protein
MTIAIVVPAAFALVILWRGASERAALMLAAFATGTAYAILPAIFAMQGMYAELQREISFTHRINIDQTLAVSAATLPVAMMLIGAALVVFDVGRQSKVGRVRREIAEVLPNED